MATLSRPPEHPAQLRYVVVATILLPYDGWELPAFSVQSLRPSQYRAVEPSLYLSVTTPWLGPFVADPRKPSF